jgi:hypothetical protein
MTARDAGLLAVDEASEARAAPGPERQVLYRPYPMWQLTHKRSIRGEPVKNREGIKGRKCSSGDPRRGRGAPKEGAREYVSSAADKAAAAANIASLPRTFLARRAT